MNKLWILLGFLLSTAVAFSQITVSISGTVTDINGNGVGDVTVYITTDTINSDFVYYNMLQTNEDGTYSDSFEAPEGATQGVIYVSMEDCNNTYQYQTTYWFPGNDPVADFVYCNVNCSVSVSETNSGTLLATAGGAAPFTYSWSNGSTQAATSVSISGNYCVTITDNNGCTSSECYYYDANVIDTLCYVWINIDSTNTSLQLTAMAGGTAPFTYLWDNGATTQSIDVTAIGEYCVSVVDAVNCVTSSCFDFGDGCDQDVYIYQNGDYLSADGNIVGNVDYEWNTGETTSGITATDEGNYCVTITYGEGCFSSDCYYYYADTTNVDSCYVWIIDTLGAPGSIQLTAFASGTAPFAYYWGTGETTQSISVAGPGEYCLSVIDANNCVSAACFDVGDGCDEQVYIYQNADYLSASANIPGVVDYSWSTGETTQGITATTEGNYCVTITYGEGCLASDCMYYYPDTVGMDSCYVMIHPIQNGSWLQATAGGTAPFSYAWSTGETGPNIAIAGDTLYCVTVTDAVGCTSIDCYDSFVSLPSISGSFSYDNGDTLFMEGIVNLYSMNENDLGLVASASAFSYYNFPDVAPGDYVLQAIVDGYLPTYHYSSPWWDEADVVTVNQLDEYAEIHLIPLQELITGPGGITGTVTEPDEFGGHDSGNRNSTPVEGAEIILFNSENAPVAFMFTDTDGQYSFEGLAYGTYTVYIELFGYEQVYYTVTIGPDTELVENIDFSVNGGSITTATRTALLENSFLSVYPNPASEQLNVNLMLELKGQANIEVMNITGQHVFSDYLQPYEQQKSINISSLNSGLFILKVTTEEGIVVQQFIKE